MDSRPHLFTSKLTKGANVSLRTLFWCLGVEIAAVSDMKRGERDILGLSNTANQLVPAVTHDGAHAEEENSRSEALGGEISLSRNVSLAHCLSS